MAGLKELRIRIDSIKSTQKITSAMKLVAAARLRRAQGLVDKSAFYSNNILSSAARLLYDMRFDEAEKNIKYVYPELMRGNGTNNNYLLLVMTSDRGLCGSYNSAVARMAVSRIEELKAEGKHVSLMCIGRKGRDLLKKRYGDLMVNSVESIAKKGAKYYEATDIAKVILDMYAKKQINVCEVVYSQFVSAISRNVVSEQILPVKIESFAYNKVHEPVNVVHGAFYEYQPDKIGLLTGMLPLVFKSSLFQAIVQSQASEHGARMSSMDNATRNASDMISRLTLKYNRIRQTAITTELIEIIAGAEAI